MKIAVGRWFLYILAVETAVAYKSVCPTKSSDIACLLLAVVCVDYFV